MLSRQNRLLVYGLPCLIAILLIGLLSMRATNIGNSIDAAVDINSEYRSSPEKLMRAFSSYIAKGDVSSALSLFDTNQVSKRFNFPSYLSRVKQFTITSPEMLPAEYTEFVNFNEVVMRSRAAIRVRSLVYSLLLPDDYSEILKGKAYRFSDNDNNDEVMNRAKHLANLLDPKKLKGFEFIQMNLASPDAQDTDTWKKGIERRLQIYNGCQDIEEYLVLYRWNNNFYSGGLTLRKFDNKWYIGDLSSSLGSTSPFGALEKTSRKEYSDKHVR